MMRRLRQLAADLVYMLDAYAWLPMAVVLVLLAVAELIDSPVLNPQNFGAL
jgi:hypothetical protein